MPLRERVAGHASLLRQGDDRQGPVELCGVPSKLRSMTSRMRARSSVSCHSFSGLLPSNTSAVVVLGEGPMLGSVAAETVADRAKRVGAAEL